ncbi:hypothetical protein O3P69_008796 [Scylla paramamosain]|uniref:Uncharacterized protein n=1 Tax=Scylla paramamosain TaxID=85552 RepID=A0AAW0TRM4_SCYPA
MCLRPVSFKRLSHGEAHISIPPPLTRASGLTILVSFPVLEVPAHSKRVTCPSPHTSCLLTPAAPTVPTSSRSSLGYVWTPGGQ